MDGMYTGILVSLDRTSMPVGTKYAFFCLRWTH
jgi:hypothetical protein